MTLGWTLFSIKALIGYAFMSGLFVIFATCLLVSNIKKPLSKWQMFVLNSSMLWVPASSIVAAIGLWFSYSKQQTNDGYYWLALPVIATVLFILLNVFIESKSGRS